MMNNNVIIHTKDLTKKFGDFTAVNAISFDVYEGEIFGFLGANGAGKTTALKILCGLSKPTRGEALVADYDVYHQREKIKKNIGYMSQKFSLYDDLTINENIVLFGGIYGMSNADIKRKRIELTEELGLERHAKELVRTLPLGWKQKLAFSIAILHEPKVVFLDEPTGGVDPITRRKFWELIYRAVENKITVFVTTHYMDEAEYCNRVSIMVEGEIYALDTPEKLKQQFNRQTMDEVFYQVARGKQKSEKV